MGIGKWIGRPGRAVLLIAVGAIGAGAAVAAASIPGSDGVIHACVELGPGGAPSTIGGNLRVIDPNATPPQGQECTTTVAAGGPPAEEAISWNAAGVRGPTGGAGATGAAGPTGPEGPVGKTLTVSGQTFTLSNGRTFTITSPPLIAPLPTNGHVIATMTLDSGHGTKTFEISGYAFATTSTSGGPGLGGGGGEGKVKFNEFTITREVDQASPSLVLACANGTHFKEAMLHVRKAGGSPYLTITLKDVLISSYQVGGHGGGGELPQESLSLNFTKIEFKYTPHKPGR
jgi:type VI secretion system secreted protein Hcp